MRSVHRSTRSPMTPLPAPSRPCLDLPDGTRLGVVISWEVFFGGRVRDGVREGGGVILNPTNGASYSGTIVQTQQIASSRLRALETGRWVVQVAPTGFSAFVTPGGDVLQRTAVSDRAVIRDTVELRARRDVVHPPRRRADHHPDGRRSGGDRGRWRFEEHGHWSVVDERHPHRGTEPPGRHRGAEVAQGARRHGRRAARPVLAGRRRSSSADDRPWRRRTA